MEKGYYSALQPRFNKWGEISDSIATVTSKRIVPASELALGIKTKRCLTTSSCFVRLRKGRCFVWH